jgi:hypothetical protein
MPRPRLSDPDNHCQHCKKLMCRKKFSGGRLEARSNFSRRKFCDFICMGLSFVGRDRGGRSDSRMRTEASEMTPMRPCEKCGEKLGAHVHHIDATPQNNDPSNLERLCPSCHRFSHITPRFCTVCGNPHKGLGFCLKHYQRFKRHGSPLVVRVWRDGSRVDEVKKE